MPRAGNWIVRIAALSMVTGSAAAQAEPPTGRSTEELAFAVVRHDDKIGTQYVRRRNSGDLTHVEIRVRIAVRVMFVTVFRFEHDSREIWRGDHLVSMWSRTHDDGEDHLVEAKADHGAGITVIGDGHERHFDTTAVPLRFWNASFLKSKNLFHPLLGTRVSINFVSKYNESGDLTGGAQAVRLRHYSITGDISRELWYDNQNLLVKMSLIGKDGSVVEYLLEKEGK